MTTVHITPWNEPPCFFTIPFKKWDRVEISAEARQRNILALAPPRRGTIVGFGGVTTPCVRVKWDGRKSIDTLHWTFVKKVTSLLLMWRDEEKIPDANDLRDAMLRMVKPFSVPAIQSSAE